MTLKKVYQELKEIVETDNGMDALCVYSQEHPSIKYWCLREKYSQLIYRTPEDLKNNFERYVDFVINVDNKYSIDIYKNADITKEEFLAFIDDCLLELEKRHIDF